MTNNFVYLDESGKESVRCSRSDGLAFDALRKLKIPTYILSTEMNKIVSSRAKKLKSPVFQGLGNKSNTLKMIIKKKNIDISNIFYIGNDLNDYHAMKLCGFSACPADSHPEIKKISNITLKTCGGNGIARELLEDIFHLDLKDILYKKEG